jgi:hypothetical protein
MGFLRYLWAKQRVLALALLVALGGLGWFGWGAASDALYFADPEHQRQPLANWMSPRYVGKSWDLPREVIIEIMQLEPDNKQKTLKDVTEHLGITLPELQARVEQARAQMDARRMLDHLIHD